MEYEEFPSLEAVTGEDVLIPCRPTSPDLNVTLHTVSNNDKLTNNLQFGAIELTLMSVLERSERFLRPQSLVTK